MPALTKAQKKQAEGTESSFHRVYATQYGEDRWNDSLLPALAAPTRYALLVNRYASDVGEDIPESIIAKDGASAQTGGFMRINFPTAKSSLSSTTESGGGTSKNRLLAYQRGPVAGTTTTALETPTSSSAQTESTDQSQQENKPSPELPFPPPQPASSSSSSASSSSLLTHWNLDAASLLAATALNPLPTDKVLDLCAAPGGKSLAVAQLMLSPSSSASPPSFPGCLHVNEPNPARNKRLSSNLRSYLPSQLFDDKKIKCLRFDGSTPTLQPPKIDGTGGPPRGAGGYDKVLLDAPCSSERHLIHDSSASSVLGGWKSTHAAKQAKIQAGLLMTALRCLRANGGRVVYATCALGKEENDGVVGKVVKEMVGKEMKKSKGPKWNVKVLGAEDVWEDNGEIGRWAERTEFGWIVLPDHGDRNCEGGEGQGEKGWGPLYFTVLEKVTA